MAQELVSRCCTSDSLDRGEHRYSQRHHVMLLAFATRAHIKTLEVETLEELMVTQTAKVEDKLVDLIENQHLIFEYRH